MNLNIITALPITVWTCRFEPISCHPCTEQKSFSFSTICDESKFELVEMERKFKKINSCKEYNKIVFLECIVKKSLNSSPGPKQQWKLGELSLY